jgi:hypothetical protein
MDDNPNVGQQFKRQFGEPNWMPTNKTAIRGVNIVSHPEQHGSGEEMDRQIDADETMNHSRPEDMWDMPASQELHTSQTHVDRAGVRSYIDRPNDPEHWDENNGYDAPSVYEHQGKLWIHEGHHRIIASRLRGDSSIKVHYWNTRR